MGKERECWEKVGAGRVIQKDTCKRSQSMKEGIEEEEQLYLFLSAHLTVEQYPE